MLGVKSKNNFAPHQRPANPPPGPPNDSHPTTMGKGGVERNNGEKQLLTSAPSERDRTQLQAKLADQTTSFSEEGQRSPEHTCCCNCDGRRGERLNKTGSKKGQKQKPEYHFSDLFLKSDIHGLPEWYESHHWWLRLIWTVILLTCTVLMVYELWRTYVDFRDNPIITTYSPRSADARRGLSFPDVYLCPSNPVHKVERYRSNIDPSWEKSNAKVSTELRLDLTLSSLLKQKETIWRKHAKGLRLDPKATDGNPLWTPRDMQDYYLRVGYPLRTFLRECAFESEQLDCASVAEEVFDGDYGKCFLIRLNRTQSVAGVGLSLVLDLDIRNAYDQGPLFDGVILRMAGSHDPASARKTLLHPATYTDVELTLKRYSLIDKNVFFSGKQLCVNRDSAERPQFEVMNVNYSRDACHMDCVQRETLKKCDCLLPFDRRYLKKEAPFCTFDQQSHCAHPVQHNEGSDGSMEECVSRCMTPCVFDELDLRLSSSRFPSDAVGEWIRRSAGGQTKTGRVKRQRKPLIPRTRPTPPQRRPTPAIDPINEALTTASSRSSSRTRPPPPLTRPHPGRRRTQPTRKPEPSEPDASEAADKWQKKDMIILDISYAALEFIEISQDNSQTLDEFFSNIGGHVGLWLGASVVTVIKFGIILFPFCFCKHRATAKRMQQVG